MNGKQLAQRITAAALVGALAMAALSGLASTARASHWTSSLARLAHSLLPSSAPARAAGLSDPAVLVAPGPGQAQRMGLSSVAQAAAVLTADFCYNWDFFNWTGVTANDLHIELEGPTALTDVYTGPLNPFGAPDATSGYDAGSGIYTLEFSGATVADGDLAHIGFCAATPLFNLVGSTGLPPFHWTLDGVPLPAQVLPMPGWQWGWLVDGVQIGLSNDTPIDIEIVSLELMPLPAPLLLEELEWDPLGFDPSLWQQFLFQEPLPSGVDSFFDITYVLRPGDWLLARVEVRDPADPANSLRLIAQAQAPTPGSIGGVTFLDADGDGVHDPEETVAAADIPVTLTNVDTNQITGTLTSISGTYLFASLPPGTYEVSTPATLPGIVRSTAAPITLLLGDGQSLVGVDFGYQLSTGVQLTVFAAQRMAQGVNVFWTTSVEHGVDGFRVWRAGDVAGAYQALSPLIPAENNAAGADYRWLDRDARPDRAYFYKLEILPDGLLVGPIPISGQVAGGSHLFLPVILR